MITENSTDWIYLTDAEGKFLYISPSCEKITGYAPSDFIADPQFLNKIIFTDDLPVANHHHKNTAKDQEPDEMEFRIINRENQVRWINHKCKPVYTSDGKYAGRRGTNQDITERKKTQVELWQSEERFKALHNSSFGGIVIHDQGVLLEVNNGLSILTGYSEEELVGMNVLNLISEKWREEVTGKMNTGYEKPYEVVALHKNGKEYPVRIEARNVPYKGKTVRVAEFRDISEQKLNEQKLLQSEEKFRMVFESANVGKSITLPTGEISVNQAFCDMLGYSSKELQNKKWQEITPPEDVAEIEQKLRPVIKGKTNSIRFEKRYIHKSGFYIWADVSTRLMRESNNNPLYYITTIVDISEKKNAEFELTKNLNLLNNLAAQSSRCGLPVQLYPDGSSAFPYASPECGTFTR